MELCEIELRTELETNTEYSTCTSGSDFEVKRKVLYWSNKNIRE